MLNTVQLDYMTSQLEKKFEDSRRLLGRIRRVGHIELLVATVHVFRLTAVSYTHLTLPTKRIV